MISRVSFGVLGANIPAIIRRLIAVAWYGIQTYLASHSLVIVVLKLSPGLAPYAEVEGYGFLGLSLLGWIASTRRKNSNRTFRSFSVRYIGAITESPMPRQG